MALADILVVDDDPDALFLVRHALETAGHHVVTTSDPTQIDRLVHEHGIDAVVLDVMMPDISGHDALRLLRRQPRTGGVPVILLSARADGPDRIQGLKQGADDFLSKPFEPEELVLRVERLLAQSGPRQPEAAASKLDSNLEQSLRRGRVVGPFSLGRYQVLDAVGEGGSGLVFRGWDPWLKRPVALKTVRFERPEASEDSPLLHEAVTVARLNHPHIVTVYDVGGDAHLTFIAMEFVHGTSLGELLRRHGKLPGDQLVPLGLAVAEGLAAAHAHHIVHHDVKPGNILLGRDGSIKVSDFGIARLLTALQQDEGTVFGTPGFLPPEMLLGEPYNELGDLFGLGALIFQAATGELPFAGRSVRELVRSTVRDPAPSMRLFEPEVPPELDRLIGDLLHKNPAKRPQAASEVVQRLRALGRREDWRADLVPSAETVGRSVDTPTQSVTVTRDDLAFART